MSAVPPPAVPSPPLVPVAPVAGQPWAPPCPLPPWCWLAEGLRAAA